MLNETFFFCIESNNDSEYTKHSLRYISAIFTSMKQISKFIQFVSHSQSNFELQLLPRLSFASTLLGYQFYPTSVTMLPYQSLLFTLTCSKFNLIRVFISPCQDHNFTLKEFQFCPARFTIQPKESLNLTASSYQFYSIRVLI